MSATNPHGFQILQDLDIQESFPELRHQKTTLDDLHNKSQDLHGNLLNVVKTSLQHFINKNPGVLFGLFIEWRESGYKSKIKAMLGADAYRVFDMLDAIKKFDMPIARRVQTNAAMIAAGCIDATINQQLIDDPMEVLSVLSEFPYPADNEDFAKIITLAKYADQAGALMVELDKIKTF